MVLTVRDEERFLAANLAYHRAMGVSRAYVFLDRCTDASGEIARSFPWVRTFEHDLRPDDMTPGCLQVRCADLALELARSEGFAWLMFLDADEFASGEDPPGRSRWPSRRHPRERDPRSEALANLPRMLGRVGPTIEQVVMRPKETVPTPLAEGEPFWKLRYFQVRGALDRPLLDPTTGRVRRLERWVGHRLGKSIVRTTADVYARSPHRWARIQHRGDEEGPDIMTEYRGWHHHFIVVSADHWHEKYTKWSEFPDRWRGGRPVPFPQQAWRAASRAMSEAEARTYYDHWVVVQPHRLLWPRLRGEVIRDTSVETVLGASASAGRTDLDPQPRPPISPARTSW